MIENISLKTASDMIDWKPCNLGLLIRAEKPKWAKRQGGRILIDRRAFMLWAKGREYIS